MTQFEKIDTSRELNLKMLFVRSVKYAVGRINGGQMKNSKPPNLRAENYSKIPLDNTPGKTKMIPWAKILLQIRFTQRRKREVMAVIDLITPWPRWIQCGVNIPEKPGFLKHSLFWHSAVQN